MVEKQLNILSLYQASLVVRKFACWNSSVLTKDVKSVINGRKADSAKFGVSLGTEAGGEATQIYGIKDCEDLVGNIHMFPFDTTPQDRFFSANYGQEQQSRSLSGFVGIDDSCSNVFNPLTQPCQVEISELASSQSVDVEVTKANSAKSQTSSPASLGILNNYAMKFSQLTAGQRINVSSCSEPFTKVSSRTLSIDAVIRLRGEKFIQSSSRKVDEQSALGHQFTSTFLGLTTEDARDVELVQYLLASAEKVSQQEFEHARELLNQCDELSSDKGNPIQRLVRYFAEALHERIDREIGTITSKGLGKKHFSYLEEMMMTPDPTFIASHQELPFLQVSEFTGVQAILDSLEKGTKVHIIDVAIRNGVQCAVLMQALAARHEYPLDYLKITAISTRGESQIEETGRQLISFAESLSISFSFKLVLLDDILNLNKDMLDIHNEEVIAVNSSYKLWTMIGLPGRLERMMTVLINTNPCVMVVTEVEANTNSPVFVTRFIESLFYYSSFFDALEDCMPREVQNRYNLESVYFGMGIRNIVATEGEERILRHVNINIWRAFFRQFQMVEKQVSILSLYQASLVVKKFGCGTSCTLTKDGECVIIGWKGKPILSLSAWRFL